MPRLFLAVPVRLEAYDALKARFAPYLKGHWSEADQLHMTLAFLGERYSAADIISRLESVDMHFEPAPVDRLGYFAANRIFHAGADTPSLKALSGRIADALELRDYHFTPHVTLMRVKELRDETRFMQLLGTCRGEALGTMETQTLLYESTLSQEGARYRRLKAWPA